MGKAAIVPLLLIAAGVLLGGCSTIVNSHTRKQPVMTAYLSGQNENTAALLQEKLQEPGIFNSSVVGSVEEIAWRLEGGAFAYLTGKYQESIRHFERTEALMEEYDQRALISLRDVSSEAAGIMTNPAALPYRGWCRDRVLLPVFKAFAYLGKQDEEGFRVELFRLRENQNRVMEDYNKIFQEEDRALLREQQKNARSARNTDPQKILQHPQNRAIQTSIQETSRTAHQGFRGFLNPFAIFLSAYGFARDGDFENAAVDYDRLCKAMPENQWVKQYHADALRRTGKTLPPDLTAVPPLDFVPGHQTVLLIFANGRSGALRQASLYIPVILPGYISLAAVAWPLCEYYPAPFRELRASCNGKEYRTVPLANMDGILAQEYTERLPGMIARIALSTAVKETAAYFANQAVRDQDAWVQASVALSTAAYKVMFNTADTRCWEMLPKEFQTMELPMPADRKITLRADGVSPMDLEIPAGARSAIIYVNAPTAAAFRCQILSLTQK